MEVHAKRGGASLAIGSLIAGRYRVESVLGQGGMGRVLGARDERTGVGCAIKLLGPNAAKADRVRLVREARALMLLSSPHIVRVFDVDELPVLGPYLVLERLSGETLAELSPLGMPLPHVRVVDCAMQVCEALSHAHAFGIVHRDIKPSNLFVTRGLDGCDVVKVLDFGISKLTLEAGEGLATLTADQTFMGSPQFLSPEQLVDPSEVDARTDLWALGVVLYRLITGWFPFEGVTLAEIFAGILEREPGPMVERGADVPAALDAIVSRCLSKEKSRRFASARELAHALRPFARDDWSARFDANEVWDSGDYEAQPPPPPLDHRFVWLSAGAILVAIGASGVWAHHLAGAGSAASVATSNAGSSPEPIEPLASSLEEAGAWHAVDLPLAASARPTVQDAPVRPAPALIERGTRVQKKRILRPRPRSGS